MKRVPITKVTPTVSASIETMLKKKIEAGVAPACRLMMVLRLSLKSAPEMSVLTVKVERMANRVTLIILRASCFSSGRLVTWGVSIINR